MFIHKDITYIFAPKFIKDKFDYAFFSFSCCSLCRNCFGL